MIQGSHSLRGPSRTLQGGSSRQGNFQVLEFSVAVEKDPVRNKVLLGKGDIETVPPFPTTDFGYWIMEGLLCGSILRVGCQEMGMGT